MEKKFEHPYCITLLKHFFGQFKSFSVINILLAIVCAPFGFIFMCVLEVLTFLRAVIASVFQGVFDYIESKNDDKTAFRVALVVVLSPFMLFKFLLTGVLGVTVFLFGFFYDISNSIMSLGKTETLFINLKKEEPVETEETYYQE